ncbi:MAG: efflux RND transporter periplasmic adaptor subunit [bacterium]
MHPSIRLTGVIATCGALALIASGCGKRGGPPAFPPAAVRTTTASALDTPIVISAFGHTQERLNLDVVSQVSGILVATFINDGAVVTNGQPLFQIDPSDYAARVRQAEGMLAADRANLALSQSTLERYRVLLEKKLVSPEDFDTLSAKAQAAAAQLQMDEALLDLARLSLTRCTITAAMSGVCSKRFVDNGNLIGAGQTRLVNIRSYDPLFVECSVSEQYLPALRQAMAAGPVTIEVIPNGDTNCYTGTLVFLDNAVDTQSGTILLRGQVPNPDLKLWARQFASIRLMAGLARAAVMVPEGAVQFGKHGTFLYTVKDGKAEMRQVKTGVRNDDRIQIVEGVAAGDAVVVLGQFMLYPGAAVREAPSATPTPATGAAATNGVHK